MTVYRQVFLTIFSIKKTDTKARSKAAQLHEPINMVNYVHAVGRLAAYERVHTSFQSTSPCNIATVNALNECILWLRKKERGTGKSKRLWGIKMNSARNLYLQSHYRIDCMDHMIKMHGSFTGHRSIGTHQCYMGRRCQWWWRMICTYRSPREKLITIGSWMSQWISGGSEKIWQT